MVPEKAALDFESKMISVQGTMIRKISLLSYATIGDYTLEPLAYGVHHRGVRLVDLVGFNLSKHSGKDISNKTGLINL